MDAVCTMSNGKCADADVVHSELFIKLIERKAPRVLLDIIMNWHNGHNGPLEWNLQQLVSNQSWC